MLPTMSYMHGIGSKVILQKCKMMLWSIVRAEKVWFDAGQVSQTVVQHYAAPDFTRLIIPSLLYSLLCHTSNKSYQKDTNLKLNKLLRR